MKLSLFPTRSPLLLLATIGVSCYLTAEDPERATTSMRTVLEGSAGIVTMVLAPDGRVLATSEGSGMVRLWYPEINREQVLFGHPAHATCVALAPDGISLAVGDANSTVSLWDIASAEIQWSVARHTGAIRALVFSPDGATLASGGTDGIVCLWDTATHRLRASLTGHTRTVTVVGFAPDGQTLVSGSRDGTIRCWDTATGKARWIIPACSDVVASFLLSAGFSIDGQVLATAAFSDPAVRLWDMATGLELSSLRGEADAVVSVCFAPDGATLAAGDCSGNVTLWDLESRRQKNSWSAHGLWVKSLAFSADGRTLASAGEGTVKLWEMAGNRKKRE